MTEATPTASVDTTDGPARRRPFGVIVLAILFVFRALVLIIALSLPSLPDIGIIARVVALPFEIAKAVTTYQIAGATILVLAALLVVAAVLVWSRRRTGWRIGILTTGFFLLVDLVLIVGYGQVFPLWMSLDVVVVFYLNQREVREWFSVTEPRAGEVATT